MSIENKDYIGVIEDLTIKEAGIDSKGIYSSDNTVSNAITGNDNFLYHRLKESFKNAKNIDIIVSFLMESGVKMILDNLEEAINRGASIRILTVNY